MNNKCPTTCAPSTPLATVSLTVGTAGHIDHGKTALVKYLTGCDCDRLPEEKARGMTIDLGFATCELPNHRRVGIVDVPGHERFIHNMVAGATGIDVVLLVVAADDGIMPQTIEHFHIVRLLGVRSGLVALNKTDLASPARIAEVKAGIENLVAGSFLDKCPILPVSCKTGEGFDAFYNAFAATVDKTAERNTSGPFRLHIERTFLLKGLGTIVSGIPRSGTVHVGDTVVLLPKNEPKKVRGLQVFGINAEQGSAGECVALRLSDVTPDQVGRGIVVATPDYFEPARFINVRFHLLPGLDKPLKPRTAVKFHIGTVDARGHLVLPDLNPLPPGQETYAQLQLVDVDPVVAAPGDFFVIRQLNPPMTLGGGYVIAPEHQRMRRTRGNWVADCEERETAFRQPDTALRYVLKHFGDVPLHASRLSHLGLIRESEIHTLLAPILAEGAAVTLPGDRYVHAEAVKTARDEIVNTLNRLHDEHPMSIGFAKTEIFPALTGHRLLIDKALEDLLASGELRSNSAGLFLVSRAPRLSPQQARTAERICSIYRESGLASPRRDQLAEIIGAPAGILAPILNHLIQIGDIVVVADNVLLHREIISTAQAKLVAHLQEHGALESGTAKDILGTTRKYSIPLLEYWDARGLTKRTGNTRTLKEKPSSETP